MVEESSKSAVSALISETFDSISGEPKERSDGTSSTEGYTAAKTVRADRAFLDAMGQIVIDMGNTAGHPEIRKAYDLMLYVQRTYGCNDYFFQAQAVRFKNRSLGLNILAPIGYPYLEVTPVKVSVNLEPLLHPELVADNYPAPSFDSEDSLLDTYRICTAISELASREAQRYPEPSASA